MFTTINTLLVLVMLWPTKLGMVSISIYPIRSLRLEDQDKSRLFSP